jgi:hypothetical protein
VLVGLFVLVGVAFVLSAVAAAALVTGAALGVADARVALDEALAEGTVASLIQSIAGIVAGVLIVRGVFHLRRSRAKAYRALELGILVDLLLAQPFAFLDVGFGAAVDVFIDLALLATLRYLQFQEGKLRIEMAPV